MFGQKNNQLLTWSIYCGAGNQLDKFILINQIGKVVEYKVITMILYALMGYKD